MDTITRGEVAEAQIDAFISRRADTRRQAEGERDEEALCMASVRRYQDRQRTRTLWDRLRYHEAMLRAHASTYEHIVRRHRLEVERCEAMLGINEKGDAA